jgi:hypothetical protein
MAALSFHEARRLAVIAVALVGLMALSACSRLYEITLDNAGSRSVSVNALHWGEHEGVDDPKMPIRLPAVPANGVRIPASAMTVSWEVPERISVTWTPDGLPQMTRDFELRKYIANPASYRNAVILEFEDARLRIYSGPTDSQDPTPKKLIAESK